jgi:hypothetical protein
MPVTINGFGTHFYGESDRRPDGSFVTTEWAVSAYVPIFPLRSFRLAPIAKGGVNVIIVHSQSYAVFEKLPIFWPQVARIYAFVVCVAIWWIAAIWLFVGKFEMFESSYAGLMVFPLIAIMAIPFAIVWRLRSRAFEKRLRNSDLPPQQKNPNELP